jgi:protein-L-isoaspartate(D-aspartate) O-methyltransferase
MDKEILIKELIAGGYLKSKSVIEAFRKIRREDFILEEHKNEAYGNYPLPIGEGQTISQPLTVAFMTEALGVKKGQKILEIGAGSGYQAAILSEIAGDGRIITVEINEKVFEFAKKNLKNFKNVTVIHGDGSMGYEKEAPYDRIIVTASAPEVPGMLTGQLKKGGKLVVPVGNEMILLEKNDRIKKTMLGYFSFVPLLGKFGHKNKRFSFF